MNSFAMLLRWRVDGASQRKVKSEIFYWCQCVSMGDVGARGGQQGTLKPGRYNFSLETNMSEVKRMLQAAVK